MSDRYLEMKNISKTFPGVKALQNVCFGVGEGEVVSLVGENGAGKSTLMNILGGVIKRDAGDICINGKPANIQSVIDAKREGIAFIHQELSLFKQLSVQENLFIDKFESVQGAVPLFISSRKMTAKAAAILKDLDINISPKQQVDRLSMGEQQMVEIACAVYNDAKIIILDEPTTSLTNKERDKLHEIIQRLKREGKLIIYITHELENAIQIGNRVVCLRDGQNAGERFSVNLKKQEVISMMIGSKAGKSFVKTKRDANQEKILEFRNVKTKTKLNGVDFFLRKGEVLGIYGLIGSGRTETIKAMYGLDKLTEGEIRLNGKPLKKYNPALMKNNGIAWLTENRRDEGLFLEQGIHFNITITNIDQFIKKGFAFVNQKKEVEVTSESVRKLQIATPNIRQLTGKLSGGNQQKVVIAKWLHMEPKIFILDEPTKGIDVGAKDEIYKLIDQIANEGVSVILISSEIEEIIGMSDRVLTMANGRISGELEGSEITNANIIHYTMN